MGLGRTCPNAQRAQAEPFADSLPSPATVASFALGSTLQVTHRDQIAFCHGTHVSMSKGNESLRLAGRQDEFDLQPVWRLHVDHRAEVSAAQAQLRQVAIEDDGVE